MQAFISIKGLFEACSRVAIQSHLRKLSLLIGLMFHLGLFLTMNLRWFPIIMLALYLALISNCLFKMLEEALYNLLSSLKHKNKGEYT